MPYKSVYIEASQAMDEKLMLGPANPQQFAQDIERSANQLEIQGYAVISTIPIVTGSATYETSAGFGWGYGLGFGKTRGVVILAMRK